MKSTKLKVNKKLKNKTIIIKQLQHHIDASDTNIINISDNTIDNTIMHILNFYR